MTENRKNAGQAKKRASLKVLRAQLRRGLYPIDSKKLTIALARTRELSLS